MVIPAKFATTEADGDGTQTLIDEMVVQTYYSNATDWTSPTVKQVQTSVTAQAGTGRSLVVTTEAADAGGVAAVVVVVAEDLTPGTPAVWRSFDLVNTGAGRWSGATPISVCAALVEIFVQVVDTAGNVGVMSNKSANFTSGCDDEPPQQPTELRAVPDPTTLDPGGSGWHVSSPVTVVVTSTISPLFYEVDGGGEQLLVESSFSVAGDGVHTYVVRDINGGISAEGSIAIDTTSPSVAIITPANGSTYTVGRVPPAVFTCSDPSLVSCTGTLTDLASGNSTPITSGAAVSPPGDYRLDVTGTDVVGNQSSASSTFKINSPPVLGEINGPVGPITLGTVAVLDVELTDDNGDDGHVVVWDYGDGTTCTATATTSGVDCSLVAPTGSTIPGTASASHLYAAPGVYEVAVSVIDASGASDTAVFRFVVVNSPPVLGEINGPVGPIALGTVAVLDVELYDDNGDDGHVVVWDYGDGTTCTATATTSGVDCSLVAPTGSTIPGTASASHLYAAPGVYEVAVSVVDASGASDTAVFRFVVVYDPSAGFATGGGWIVPGGPSSNPGDTLPGLDGVSKAHFAFVVKYKKGKQVPDGGLSFRYQVGDFRLESVSLDWLVVNPGRAQFQGTAEIDGMSGLYPFKVEADDKDGNPGQQDRFVIKIWDDGADPTTDDPLFRASGDLGGGQIKVKTK